MKTHAIRLKGGQDLRDEIDKFSREKGIGAGCVVSCVGSLEKAVVRGAGATAGMKVQPIKELDGPFEIVSMVGTLELGNSHLHISFSDEDGKVMGGHLRSGTIVRTTAEIVIGELMGMEFLRELDPETGFEELKIKT